MTRAWLLLALVATALSGPARAGICMDPGVFVRGLYDRYGKGGTLASPTADDADKIFDKPLLALIRRDQARAHGEAGLLDHDPICDCQDYDGLAALRVSTDATGPTADVTARFTISADHVVVHFYVVRTMDCWRISDIRTRTTPSLKAFLARGSAHN